MVEKFEINLDKKKQVDKYVRVKPIISLVVLAVYIVVVLTTALVLKAQHNKMGVARGSMGSINGQVYYEVIVYNIDADGSTLELNLDDFELEYGGMNNYDAVGYKLGENGTMQTDDVIKLLCNETEKTIIVYFKGGSASNSILFNFYELRYKGDELESRVPAEALKTERTVVIVFETIVILIVWAMIFAVLNAKNAESGKARYYKNINEQVLSELGARSFNVSKQYYLPTPKTGATNLEKLMICVDSKAKKCCFVDYGKKKAYVVDFNDIVSHKVIENNGVRVEEEISVFGMSPTQTTKNVCKKLNLVIVMDDIDDTNVVYELIKSGISIDSATYKNCTAAVIEVTSFLEVIKNKMSASSKEQRFVYCSYCGAKNKGESLRCESCGGPLKD